MCSNNHINPNGDGIGLYASKGIAEQLQGKLEFENTKKDQGSIFTLSLKVSVYKSREEFENTK